MTRARILRLSAVAGLVLAVTACAPCPIPQPAPAQPVPHPPAPLEPSRVEPGDTQVVEVEPPRALEVQIRTTQEGASGQFAPGEIRVRRGDVVRFRMADGYSIHNVSFARIPGSPGGALLPPDGPFLTREGQSWQTRIDLPPGRYAFVCLPHAEAGHRGTLVVEP
ncbi:MAG TPA: plastocyanin/azurin family copper-binding protein [Longimicrobium sp.]